MSHIVTGIVQRKLVGSPTRKAVLMYMAGCASDDGSGVWTSKKNMANDLEMSKRTVQNCVDDLIAAGLVSEAGKRPCLNGYTVEYQVNLSAVSRLESTRAGHSPVQHVHVTGETGSPQDVQHVHPNRPLTVHEPLEHYAGARGDADIDAPKKARLPSNWVPTVEDEDYAKSLGLTEPEIEEIANDFQIYWHDRTDAGGRKSERGWRQTWRNRCRDVAPQFRRSRNMAGGQAAFGHGQGGSIAGIVARRRADGKV